MVRIADLVAAEKALDDAMEELRAYANNPDRWSAHERLDDDDRKVLVIHRAHFERMEDLQLRVEAAQNRLRAIQAEFGQGS